MNVTAKLVRLHLVELQLRGLTGRLKSAESYLQSQTAQLGTLTAKRDALAKQVRQLEATIHNHETEIASIEDRVAKLREQMNQTKTHKEYAALVTEVNTLKADRGLIEEKALASMTQLDALRAEASTISVSHTEREKLRAIAQADRDQREAEIRDRLQELNEERARVAAEVPPDALKTFEQRAKLHPDDDLMAPLEEHDRRHMEYACGACQVLLPMEKLNGLLGRGDLTLCSNCGVILYLEDSVRETHASKR